MGAGYYNHTAHDAAKMLRAATGASAFAYTDVTMRGVSRSQWKPHENLDPKGVEFRESRDSTEHPTSVAIAVLFDVTGSMRGVPRVIQEHLPKFMDHLLQNHYVEHPQVLFGAIGDATYRDPAPLQIGQFESDNRMEENLGNILLVGGGGDGRTESYELALYFMARHTSIDCFEQRGIKGYLFIIGDEMAYDQVDPLQLADILDVSTQETISFENIVKEAQEKYEIFFVVPSGAVNRHVAEVENFWKKALGDDHFIALDDPSDVCDVLGVTIAKDVAAKGLANIINP